jgi:hypothetical protein
VAPAYRYREVERVNYYYPVREYGHRGWGDHGHDRGDRPWGHRDDYRHGDQGSDRGGDHRGWDRRD